MELSIAIKNARAEVLCDKIDENGAKLIIYNAPQEVMCALDFKVPSKLSIVDGVLTFQTLEESMVLISDLATDAKIISNNGDTLANVSMTEINDNENSNADLKLPSLNLYAGSLLRLVGWTITEL